MRRACFDGLPSTSLGYRESVRIQFHSLRQCEDVEGYNPRLHFVVFCPQLCKHHRAGRLIPLRAAEIGQFIACALSDKANLRAPHGTACWMRYSINQL